MEIAVVGATAVVTLDGGTVSDARVAITALAPTIRRVPEAEQALVGSDGGADAVEAAARGDGRGVRPDQRRARLGRVPPRDGRGDRPPRDRAARSPARAATTSRSPPAPRCTAPTDTKRSP